MRCASRNTPATRSRVSEVRDKESPWPVPRRPLRPKSMLAHGRASRSRSYSRKDNRADWARLPCHAICRYCHHLLRLFDERPMVVEICRWCRPNIRGERERQGSLSIDVYRHDIVAEQTPAALEQPHHQRALASSRRTRQRRFGPVFGRGTGVQPEEVWMCRGEVGPSSTFVDPRTCSGEPATYRPAESRSSKQDAVGSLQSQAEGGRSAVAWSRQQVIQPQSNLEGEPVRAAVNLDLPAIEARRRAGADGRSCQDSGEPGRNSIRPRARSATSTRATSSSSIASFTP